MSKFAVDSQTKINKRQKGEGEAQHDPSLTQSLLISPNITKVRTQENIH